MLAGAHTELMKSYKHGFITISTEKDINFWSKMLLINFNMFNRMKVSGKQFSGKGFITCNTKNVIKAWSIYQFTDIIGGYRPIADILVPVYLLSDKCWY